MTQGGPPERVSEGRAMGREKQAGNRLYRYARRASQILCLELAIGFLVCARSVARLVAVVSTVVDTVTRQVA